MENLNYINTTVVKGEDGQIKEEIKENKVKKFSEMISDRCYDRIYNRKITSIEYVLVAKCMNDFVEFPFIQPG